MIYKTNIPDSVKFAKSLGVPTTNIEQLSKQVVKTPEAHFYTPTIIEESTKNQILLSVFDKMASDRVLFVNGEVNEAMSAIIQAQLLYMDINSEEDISMYINSPGGSVTEGLVIYDTMNFINSDINTLCTGICASMGSILVSSGTKGKRFIMKNGRIMLHKVSSGARGVIDDMEISLREAQNYNKILFEILANNTGQTYEKVLEDSQRDFWLGADESVAYGLVDKKILSKKEM